MIRYRIRNDKNNHERVELQKNLVSRDQQPSAPGPTNTETADAEGRQKRKVPQPRET